MSRYFFILPICTVVLGRGVAVHNISSWISPDAKTLPEADTTANENNFIEADIPCSLITQNRTIPFLILKFLSGETKLIVFTLNLDLTNTTIGDKSDTTMFNPLKWMKTTGRQGTRLLFLHFEYEYLSLHSLSIGVEHVNVPLKQSPEHCFDSLNVSKAEDLLRQVIMDNFQNRSTETENLESTKSVCNLHVLNESGFADFRYKCCQQNFQGQMGCFYLYEDKWVQTLSNALVIMSLLIFLVCPSFVPKSLFKDTMRTYVYRPPENENLTMNVYLCTKEKETSKDNNITVIESLAIKNMSSFWKTVSTLKYGVTYRFRILELYFKVKSHRLIAENGSNFGIVEFLYNMNSRMKKLSKQSGETSCVSSKVCCCCLNIVKALLGVALLLMPWIMRIIIYIEYEKPEQSKRSSAATARNLIVDSESFDPGFLVYRFTMFLLPLGVILYIFKCLSKGHAREAIKFVSRFCFLDDHDYSVSKCCKGALKRAFQCCSKLKILGIFLSIFIWPFSFVYCLLHVFPLTRIIARAYILCTRPITSNRLYMRVPDKSSVNGILSDNEEPDASLINTIRFSDHESLIRVWICSISLYFVTMILMSAVFITQGFVFILEVLIYTLIGIVLNAPVTMTYVSLSLFLVIYAKDCFDHVSKSFITFNKFMNMVISELAKVNQASQNASGHNDQNKAYQTGFGKTALRTSIIITKTSNGLPKWKAAGLHSFIDKDSVPYIPRSLLYSTCKMSCHNVPGGLESRYLRACFKFGCIAAFLFFVGLAILALGDTFNVSRTNQIFALLLTGVLPKLTSMFIKNQSETKIEKDNILFQRCRDETLNNFSQSWPIHDIVVDPNFDHVLMSDDMVSYQQQNNAYERSPLLTIVFSSSAK